MSNEVQLSSTTELLDKQSARGLYNLMPPDAQIGVDKIHADWLDATEEELERTVKPTALTNRLRHAFWREYEMAQSALRKMSIHNIAINMGIPAPTIAAHLRNPRVVIWVIQPPSSYDNYLDEALEFGLRRMRNDILTMNIYDSAGQIEVKKADLLLKAIAFIDMRKNGGIVSKNLHIHESRRDFKKITQEMSLKDIEEKIKELESKNVIKDAIDATSNMVVVEDE